MFVEMKYFFVRLRKLLHIPRVCRLKRCKIQLIKVPELLFMLEKSH